MSSGILKETADGRVVVGGNFNHRKTACKHEEVDYVPRFQGMTEEEVRSHIMPLLISGRGAYVEFSDDDDVLIPL